LQAYLDGELNPDEARTMDALLASDSDAIALAEELRRTRDAIRGNELLAAAPPQRDFYWSQIEKQILAQPPRPTQPVRQPLFLGWRQLLASFAGVTAVFAFLFYPSHRLASPAFPFANEVEVVGDQTEAVVLHDQTAKMTMVFFQPRSTSFTPSATEANIQTE
jgi:anti-sigma factor RsiW